MTRKKIAILCAIVAVIAAYFYFGAGRYLSLGYLKQSGEALAGYYQAHPTLTIGGYFILYVIMAASSLPGAAILTLAGGALFGLVVGTIVVSFASSIGATLAFLVARTLFRDAVLARFRARLQRIDQGVRREGALYLFSLRLVPAVPFFVINLVMGLTAMRAWTFYWVSQLGMLAGTIVYVNAGTQLAHLKSTSDLVSARLIGAFVLLAVFPWIARWVLQLVRRRVVYRGWRRPRSYDRNLVVIGAGSAGLVSAYIAAATRARVTLVERQRMGGDCLNTGCVPSKAILKSAKVLQQSRKLENFGLEGVAAQSDFPAVMARVRRVIDRIAPHDSVERYTGLGVECLQGTARIVSPWEVEIESGSGTERLTTRAIIIASGGAPFVPPIPGIDQMPFLTSDTVWDLAELPGRMLVLGGGPIGCELAQAFARLGARVTQVEMLPRLMAREDPDASALVEESLRNDGVEIMLNTRAERFAIEDGERVLHVSSGQGGQRLVFDEVLVAVGRRGNTGGLGLDQLGIATLPNGTVETNEYLQTRFPNIYACGDVAGPYQFTHVAAHQAWYAAVNALFGMFRKFKVDYSVIPWATFTEPEVARVGVSESDATAQGIDFEVTRFPIDDLDRAIADGVDYGFVKVITARGSDRILGVTIVGEHAADLLAEYVLAMKHRLGLNRILGTIHIYPTLAEANKYAAGAWRRAHAPEGLLQWVERLHGFLRGS